MQSMTPIIEKTIKALLLAVTILSGSCASSPENNPAQIRSYVTNWHPRENDGVSLDFIAELWNDMKPVDGVSMVPTDYVAASGSFDIVEKTKDSHVLVDHQGNEYALPPDISSQILKWEDDPQPSIRAWFLVFTARETNKRHVLAVALDGGPFYKTAEAP